jgi:hypothetical protein
MSACFGSLAFSLGSADPTFTAFQVVRNPYTLRGLHASRRSESTAGYLLPASALQGIAIQRSERFVSHPTNRRVAKSPNDVTCDRLALFD